MSRPVKYKAGHVVSKLLGVSQSVLGQETVQECQAELRLFKDSTIGAYRQTGTVIISEHEHAAR